MPTMPPTFRPRGRAPRQQQNREADARRGSARERGYTRAWDKASKGHLRSHPLCRYCEVGVFAAPRVTAATLTDHLYPHRRFEGVFWLRALWVSSCGDCHNAKQTVEHQGLAALDALARRIASPTLAEVTRPRGAVESLGPLPSGPAA